MEKALAINLNRLEYKNFDAPENLIRYITRTRIPEDPEKAKELLLWGTASGYTYHPPVEEIIFEYESIIKSYRATGSLMCHYVLQLKPDHLRRMNNNLYTLGNYAVECCNYIHNLGHQVCFAIHYSEKDKVHIHFAISTVNYRTGYKLRQHPKEIIKNIEIPFYQILDKYTYRTTSFTDFSTF